VVIVAESATDAEIITAVEEWLGLLEREDYDAAAAEIDSPPGGVWTPELLRHCVNYHGYSDRNDHRVTLRGVSREENIAGRVFVRTQRREVIAPRSRTTAQSCTRSGTICSWTAS
jgi:hypothetical protein